MNTPLKTIPELSDHLDLLAYNARELHGLFSVLARVCEGSSMGEDVDLLLYLGKNLSEKLAENIDSVSSEVGQLERKVTELKLEKAG